MRSTLGGDSESQFGLQESPAYSVTNSASAVHAVAAQICFLGMVSDWLCTQVQLPGKPHLHDYWFHAHSASVAQAHSPGHNCPLSQHSCSQAQVQPPGKPHPHGYWLQAQGAVAGQVHSDDWLAGQQPTSTASGLVPVVQRWPACTLQGLEATGSMSLGQLQPKCAFQLTYLGLDGSGEAA